MNHTISTITMSLQIPNCTLNLMNVGKYLEIDENIVGVKYNFGKSSILKGKYSTCMYKKSKIKNEDKINKKLFYNQVSIVVSLNEQRTVNVKLFGNGSLHLTGIKQVEESTIVANIIFNKLLKLKTKKDNVLLTLDTNNVYIDNDNNVYSLDKHTIIGYKYTKNGQIVYNIFKKDYQIDVKTGCFLSTNFEKKRTKSLLDFNGKRIGTQKLILLKNKTKLYKNNANVYFDFSAGLIYYDGEEKSTIIGSIVYEHESYKTPTIERNIIQHTYDCNPFIECPNVNSDFSYHELKTDVNCINTLVNLKFLLNRERLFTELLKRNLVCEYKPEKYSGVKLRYKVSSMYVSNGICKCTNKCTCKLITFLIFQSGSVIATGFKSTFEIEGILKEFNSIIVDIENIVRKKMLM